MILASEELLLSALHMAQSVLVSIHHWGLVASFPLMDPTIPHYPFSFSADDLSSYDTKKTETPRRVFNFSFLLYSHLSSVPHLFLFHVKCTFSLALFIDFSSAYKCDQASPIQKELLSISSSYLQPPVLFLIHCQYSWKCVLDLLSPFPSSLDSTPSM